MRRLASRPAYRTDRSAAAYAAAQRVVAGGINSGARGPRAGWVPGPPVVHHGRGPRIWDVDGNEYVDYLLALGPLIHGHAHPALIGAVEAAMSEIGTMFALPYELEAAAAERIVAAVPSAELVRFGNSGTEVVLHAVRLARAVTGRPRILRFEGHYHGWADQVEWSHHPPLEAAGPRSEPRPVPGSPGIPAALAVAARSLQCSPSRSWATPASSRRSPATWRRSATSPGATMRSSSSTR